MVVSVLLAAPALAVADMEYASAQPQTTQYVIVVDDSGSMRVQTRDGPAADPERLAIFATQSLLSLLDERDEVTVVRLNGPADGEAVTPVAPLSENRATLDDMLSLDATMAQYPGRRTPCVQALDAVQDELNEAYRPGVQQVVLFLTDGECNDGELNAAQYLSGVDSYGEDHFQFYLLRWRGRVYSEYLVELANQSGGGVSIVGAEDPTDLLSPFADVMSQSQGYEAYRLTPRDSVLPAHKGARRVRMLAVAPDQGNELSFEISADAQGESPEQIGATQTGVHQYEDGGRYRYAVLEYRPGTTPVNVAVAGAADDWQVVALPEYRLFVGSSIHQGRCGKDGEEVTYSEVGGDVCVTMRLLNEEGQQVTSDVAGRSIEGAVDYRGPDDEDRRSLPANQVGDEPVFRFERANLDEGDHVFHPRIMLQGEQGDGVAIRGASRSLQVSTQRVESDPGRLEVGDLLPGTEHYYELTIDGNFPTTRGRLVVEGRERVPECLRFALNGVEEGESQSISAGQSYTVEVHVDPYCGPSSGEFTIDTALRVQFDQSSQSAPIPSLVLPIRGSLIHDLRAPAALETSIRAGQEGDVNLRVAGNHQRDIEFTALVPARGERHDWPRRHLELEFFDGDGEPIEPASDGSLSASVRASSDADNDDPPMMRVRANSGPCCDGGNFRTELALASSTGVQSPLRIPIDVSVEEASTWQCWGPMILRGLLLALALLLLAYIVNMWRSSRFLDPDSLADRLVPLEWDDFGEARPRNEAARDVRSMVRDNMSFLDRAKAWLKANPLVFGLPGREYCETVELVLQASPNVRRSRLRLVSERDFIADLRSNPRRGMARMYATARGGLSFYAVPAEGGRVGVFELDQGYGGFDEGFDDEPFEPDVEHIRRRREFLSMHTDREPDSMAGWRVG